MPTVLRRIPLLILALVACDLALVIAPIVDFALGSPFNRLRNLLNLGGEMTIQSWYSSSQWLLAAGLFGIFFVHAYKNRFAGAIPIGLLGLLFIVFSVDETVGVHEWLGDRSDALLPGGDRANTALSRTGIWPILIGLPVLAILASVIIRVRHVFLPRSRRALYLLVTGVVVMFTGALAVELAVNMVEVTPGYSGWLLTQHVIEEFMEMLGVTIIVWSGLELLGDYGFELRMPASTPAHARAQSVRRKPQTIAPGHPAM